ncbi:neuroguidin isoform X1 [Brachionus plicatilis]|uniref:Neuroguidin isoform X1 n=1 Tax=Brachionus plicatilis TaxID=10195 RepID=A0A3M7SGN2_BRAPC|nr:neuroguidin isoform X1 [Brachionus plicatilis]
MTIENDLNGLSSELSKNLSQFCPMIEKILDDFNQNADSIDNGKGISFLSMKNMLLIEYLANLLNLTYLKTSGKKINGNPCVQRLAELRCVLEKTKSIEFKLKYQIDKLLKMASNVTSDEQHPLSFKANADAFEKSDQEDEDDDVLRKNDEDQDQDGKKDGIYRPPKLAPVYNDIDQTSEEKAKREIERLKRRAMSSSIMKEIENEYSGAPEEIKDSYANTIETESNEHKHKIEYEEENFVRTPMTKKEMLRIKRLKRGTNLDSLASFDDARLLLDDNLNAEDYLSARKEKKKAKVAKHGKKGKNLKKKKKIRYT